MNPSRKAADTANVSAVTWIGPSYIGRLLPEIRTRNPLLLKFFRSSANQRLVGRLLKESFRKHAAGYGIRSSPC
jgi:hypothetical protein